MNSDTNPEKLPRLHGALMPFLAFLLFAVLFFAVTKVFPADTAGLDNIGLFQKYSPYGGATFGLLSMIGMYIVYGLCALFRLTRFRVTAPILLILGYAPWAAFGYQLVFREPRYATIAKMIIAFAGKPLLYTGGAIVALGLVWLLITLIKPLFSK